MDESMKFALEKTAQMSEEDMESMFEEIKSKAEEVDMSAPEFISELGSFVDTVKFLSRRDLEEIEALSSHIIEQSKILGAVGEDMKDDDQLIDEAEVVMRAAGRMKGVKDE